MTHAPLPLARLAEIEDASLNASAAPQQLWMDGWLLRFSPGKAKRARCIHALAQGRTSVAAKLARAQACYAQAGLPLVLRITPFSEPANLDDELAAAGLQRLDPTAVLAADLAHLDHHAELPAGVELTPLGHAGFAHVVGRLRGSPMAQQQAHAERLAASPTPFHAFALMQDGVILACGQYAREDCYVGLYDVFTAPQARNRGLARTLCAALLRQARALGATTAYLQVDVGNDAALAVYRRLGFAEGYRYHYRAADPDRA